MDIAAIHHRNELTETGVWVGDIDGFGDIEILAMPADAPAFSDALNERLRNVPPEDRGPDGQVPDALRESIVKDVTAEVLVRDWKNLVDGGEPIPFSAETCREFLDNGVFYKGIKTGCGKAKLQIDAAVETRLGNLRKPSPGTSETATDTPADSGTD